MREEFGDETEFSPVARKHWNDQNGEVSASSSRRITYLSSGLDCINYLIIENEEKAGTLLALSNK